MAKFQILECFDKGKCWEKGMPLLKDLCHFYASQRLDIENWDQTCESQRSLMDKISTVIRPEAQYFRVAFFGMGFPTFVRVILFSTANEERFQFLQYNNT